MVQLIHAINIHSWQEFNRIVHNTPLTLDEIQYLYNHAHYKYKTLPQSTGKRISPITLLVIIYLLKHMVTELKAGAKALPALYTDMQWEIYSATENLRTIRAVQYQYRDALSLTWQDRYALLTDHQVELFGTYTGITTWLYNFLNGTVTLKNILRGFQYYALYSCLCWWTNNKKQQAYKIVKALEHMLRSRQHTLFIQRNHN